MAEQPDVNDAALLVVLVTFLPLGKRQRSVLDLEGDLAAPSADDEDVGDAAAFIVDWYFDVCFRSWGSGVAATAPWRPCPVRD